jgi:protein-S-isoprenylcysteine O-methyltransferase Ste14
MISHYWFEIPWMAFAAYWAIGALRTRATVRREPFLARYGVMLIEVIGFTLLLNGDASIGLLRRHIVPPSDNAVIVGIVLTWIGIGLAMWARFHLGQYWSGRITLKEGHELIRTGPYARLRHPIYTGLVLAAIGSALVINHWRCAVGVAVIMIGFVIKAKREEALLAGQFGEAFQEHIRHTGFLLPKI